MEILQKYNVRTPKILYMNKDYSIQEYIEGQLLSDIFEDHEDIDKNIIKQIYDKLNISSDVLLHLYNNVSKISDSRNLSIIHGDRHKKNAILSDDGELTL